MKKRAMFYMFICCVWLCLSFGMTAFAGGLVPYEGGSSGSSPSTSANAGTDNQDDVHDYAGEIFSSMTYTEDPTVTKTVNTIAQVTSWVITFVVGTMPHLLAIVMVVDLVCLLLPQINSLLAGAPIKLYSDTVTEINGIQFTGNSENGASGGTTEKKDLKGYSKYLYYFRTKLPELIFAFAMFLLLYTGLLFKLVFFVVNHIVGWIDGIV